MKLTAKVHLNPTPEQHMVLLETLERCNAACTWISEQAWQAKTFRQYDLHKLVYYAARERFQLPAQMTVRCIAKVADAYKLDKKVQRVFAPHGAIAFDVRLLTWYTTTRRVSLCTLHGREKMTYQGGPKQHALLETQQGESDLAFVHNRFYLLATCTVETAEPVDVTDALGVDVGITQIAVDSDGVMYSGKAVQNVRYRNQRLRSKLQRKGTRSAKRKLKRRSKHEHHFVTNTNHCISKAIVASAEHTQRSLVMEDLTGIRARIRGRTPQRATLEGWSFSQLRQFITYKAERVGVRVEFVDPRNTSRTCPECGCIDKHNRVSQASFKCIACGYVAHADCNAAVILRRRASIRRPLVSACHPHEQARNKPSSLGDGI